MVSKWLSVSCYLFNKMVVRADLEGAGLSRAIEPKSRKRKNWKEPVIKVGKETNEMPLEPPAATQKTQLEA